MKSATMFAAILGVTVAATTAWGGEKIKIPNGSTKAAPKVTAAVDHGAVPVSNVGLRRRMMRRSGYGGYYGGYTPYYSYRPYYGGYGYGYGGYYTRPYYGYSYYTPGWGYGGWGPGMGMGMGAGLGIGPMARMGGWYW